MLTLLLNIITHVHSLSLFYSQFSNILLVLFRKLFVVLLFIVLLNQNNDKACIEKNQLRHDFSNNISNSPNFKQMSNKRLTKYLLDH